MYSIDTSALVDCWWRLYSPDVFPTVWTRLEELAQRAVLVATEEVRTELARRLDDLHRWATGQAALFVPIDAGIQAGVTGIVTQFPRLVGPAPTQSHADPFVIALAQQRGFTVVTSEQRSNNPHKPMIPDVCVALNIPCMNLLGMFRQQGWKI